MESQSEYILLIEDDIGFRVEGLEAIEKAITRKRTHLWFTIPELTCIRSARQLGGGVYRLINPIRLYYSGAVLISRHVLKSYVEDYLIHHVSYPFKNFDVTLSTYLNERFGFIDLSPSYFGTLPDIESAAGMHTSDTSRLDIKYSALDPYFDPHKVVPELL